MIPDSLSRQDAKNAKFGIVFYLASFAPLRESLRLGCGAAYFAGDYNRCQDYCAPITSFKNHPPLRLISFKSFSQRSSSFSYLSVATP